MILFVGQIALTDRGRGAFQEVDYREVFGGLAKWATEIDQAERIPEIISRAFHVATSGRPGPVVIALPEDMLTDVVEAVDAEPYQVTEQHPAPAQMADLAKRFAAAKSPETSIKLDTVRCARSCSPSAARRSNSVAMSSWASARTPAPPRCFSGTRSMLWSFRLR